jgi:PAS domain S-box-containing protein
MLLTLKGLIWYGLRYMAENERDLPSKLAIARQQLQDAQARVADLEAQLFAHQSGAMALAASEDRYHRTLDNMLEGCQIIGFDWRYLYVNETVVRHARRAKDELLGYTMMECYPGIEKTAMFAVLQRCMRERTFERMENEFAYPDGVKAWFELSIQPVPEGVFVLSLDITARKQSVNALLQSEQRLRLFIEHAPAAIAMFDRDMRYLSVSQRWLTDYRLSEPEIIGRSHYDIFPDIPQRWREIHQRCLNGAVEKSEADPFPRADGALDWVRWEIHPWRDASGEIGGIVLFSEVITARKQAEERIRKLNRTLEMLSDINQAIVRIRHIPTLFETACQIAVEKGGFRMAWIGRWDETIKRVTPAAYAGIADDDAKTPDFDLGDEQRPGPIAIALRTGEPVVVNDIEHDLRMASQCEEALRLGYRALVVFSLNVAGEARGTFSLYATETDFFDAEELRMLDEVAGDIAFALEFAEQEEQRQQAEAARQRHAQRLEMLHTIDLAIIRGRSLQELIQSTLTNLQQLIPCQRANVTLIDETTGEGRVFAVVSDITTDVGRGTRILIPPGWLEEFGAGHTRIIPDLRVVADLPPAYEQLAHEEMVSALQALLMFQGRPIGMLALWADTAASFSPEHQEIAEQVASQFAIALHQMRLTEALERHAAQLEQNVAERTADLQAAKERVEAILNNSPDGILLLGADHSIQQTNASFDTLFGCQADDYFGQSLAALSRVEDADTVTQIIQMVAAEQQRKRFEIRAIRKDGIVFHAELSVGFIQGDGLVCVIRDISERKQAEAALRQALAKEKELGELKSRFVSMASHEFRTPLATIMALTETLSAYRHKLSEDQIDQRFDKIKVQVGHLKDIMEDVLLLARMQARRVEFNPTRLDLDALCRSVLDEFQSRADVTHLIEYTCHAALRDVMLDPKLMRHIVNNLVSNAIKYSPSDKSIHVHLDHDESTVILEVCDEGMGIPEADLPHLFEPFHRAANVGAIPGTGLGLVIIKESVELHGGTITVTSQIDVGTTFTIRIPIVMTRESNNDENPGH